MGLQICIVNFRDAITRYIATTRLWFLDGLATVFSDRLVLNFVAPALYLSGQLIGATWISAYTFELPEHVKRPFFSALPSFNHVLELLYGVYAHLALFLLRLSTTVCEIITRFVKILFLMCLVNILNNSQDLCQSHKHHVSCWRDIHAGTENLSSVMYMCSQHRQVVSEITSHQ